MNKLIDLSVVEKRCLAPVEDFYEIGEVVDTRDGVYIYKDNGSNILAVAHLDSVNYLKHFITMKWNGLNIVFTSQVDDRVGAYTILDLLPMMGIHTDILLTEGEEMGRSTANYFDPPPGKEYNWMFSFDREGQDVVLYEYENYELEDQLEEVGFDVGFGSFSDICYLNHLHCIGINVGTGYYDSHSKTAHFAIEHLLAQVNLFKKFYQKYHDVYMPYDYLDPKFTRRRFYNYGAYGGWDDYYNWGSTKHGAGTTRGIYKYGQFCKDCGKMKLIDAPYYTRCKNCGTYHSKVLPDDIADTTAGETLLLPTSLNTGATPKGTTKLTGAEYDWCDYCRDQVEPQNLTYVVESGYICTQCLVRYYAQCGWCGYYFEKQGQGTFYQGDYYCYGCLDEIKQVHDAEEAFDDDFVEDGNQWDELLEEGICPHCGTELVYYGRTNTHKRYHCSTCEASYDLVTNDPYCTTCKQDLKRVGGLSGKEWECPSCKAIWVVER